MKQFVLSFNPAETPADTDNESVIEASLSGREHHYLIHVRRYCDGDIIPALSPDGRNFEMKILQAGKESCKVELRYLLRESHEAEEPLPRITLIPAVTKGKKMDLTIRQAVETGVFAIWPVLTEYCQVKYRNDSETSGKSERWKRIAVEALQQCGGNRATELDSVRTMKEVLKKWDNRGPLFFLHEKISEETPPLSLHRHLAEPVEDLAIMTGPEGGLSPSETRQLLDYGGKPIYLGERVLRAETAAIYGIAAVSTIIRERTEWQTV